MARPCYADNHSTFRSWVRHGIPTEPEGSSNARPAPPNPQKLSKPGKITCYRNSAGQRLYDVATYLHGKSAPQLVCYCRVRSAQRRGDLHRQVAQMRQLYPDAEVVTDIAGGLNWQRKGLLSILERLHRGDKLDVVVAQRDRLARFGFELIEWLVQQNGGAVLDSQPVRCQPRVGAHRGSTRHPPYVQLPDARAPTLPSGNRAGYESIRTNSRRQ